MGEVATEAYSSITDVTNCPKNDDHTTPFIRFNEFKLEDLPPAIRTEEIYDYLKYLGQTVVRLTVRKEDRESIYGSGVVYKIDDKYAILTNEHVVEREDHSKNTTIDFFYDDEAATGTEQGRGGELRLGSNKQDRCVFKFSPIPQRIQDLHLANNIGLMAFIIITYKDGTKRQHLAFPQATRDGHFLLVNRLDVDEERWSEMESCDIFIKDPEGNNHPIEYSEVSHREEKVLFVRVKALPDFVVDGFKRLDQLTSSASRDEIVVVTIAHPHGGPKMITFGKVITVSEEGCMKKLLHTARTCPGSSGGLVVAISKSQGTASNRGFAPNVCCHCEGDKMAAYRGIVLETQNFNTSLFNM